MTNTLPAVVFTVAILFGPLTLIATNNASTEADLSSVQPGVERVAVNESGSATRS